jgi:hypothetical protein
VGVGVKVGVSVDVGVRVKVGVRLSVGVEDAVGVYVCVKVVLGVDVDVEDAVNVHVGVEVRVQAAAVAVKADAVMVTISSMDGPQPARIIHAERNSIKSARSMRVFRIAVVILVEQYSFWLDIFISGIKKWHFG